MANQEWGMTTNHTPTPQPPEELVEAWRAAADAVLNFVNGVTSEMHHDKQQLESLIWELEKTRDACERATSNHKPTLN